MLCSLYSKMNQLCRYIYTLFLKSFSHLDHYRVLRSVRRALQEVPIVYFTNSSVYLSPPISQFIPHGFFPLVTKVCFLPSVTLFLFHKKVYLCLKWLIFKNFYWSIVALQCYIIFRCTAKLISYIYLYIHTHTHTLFFKSSLQN